MGRKLYVGGTILTMAEDGFAEALLTEEGRILAVGAETQVRGLAGDGETEVVQLEGKTVMPAFIDAHSHFSACASAFLQGTVEGAESFDELVETIRGYIREKQIPAGKWVAIRDFDPGRLKEGRVPDRRVLDLASKDHPIVLQHKSGHVGVLNSMGLQAAGIGRDTPDPAGGRIWREAGEPTGYLEENAFLSVLGLLPSPTDEELMEAYEETQRMYASYGIATVQEGLMTRQMLPLYQKLCGEKRLWLEVVGYPSAADIESFYQAFPPRDGQYENGFRLGGCKMFLDGSPQSRTAWMRTPYVGGEDCGYPVLTDGQVYETVAAAAGAGRQILAHCNGDRAAEQYLQALKRAEEEGLRPERVRPVMIHAQLLGLDQLPELKRLGVIPSFFVAHVYHWGDTHIKNFGLERAASISPAASAGKLGLPYTFHQDAPVIRPDMLETVWCAVNRRTRDGVLLGGSEQVTVLEALRAVTIRAAYQYFEEKEKGSLEPGKQADLVILDKNPLETDPSCLRKIQVLETVKAGETVYRREK